MHGRVGHGGAGNAGSLCEAVVSAPLIWSGRVENRTDRNTAVPRVPPIWRKNVTDEVATPISRGGDSVLHGQDERLHVAAEADAQDA